MTNQNLVVSDKESGISLRITVSLSKSPLFPQTISVPRLLFKQLETENESTKINALFSVDSMRASSPTRARSAATSEFEPEELNSWIAHHPSALSRFDEIVNASKGKRIVMFLDYDGTLSPIVENPDRAFMSTEMREVVRDTARYFPTAIVTGRSYDKVYSFVKLPGLYYAGSHGMDIKGPSQNNKYKKSNNQPVCFQAGSEYIPMIEEVCKILEEKTKSIQGARVENNKFCLSVHFRCVDDKKWGVLAELVTSVMKDYPKLKLTHGRKVLEIRPTIKWDKGTALHFLLEALGYANSVDVLPIYIGDDRTDEDAFKVLRARGQGFGILVSKVAKETDAAYSLQEPAEVKDFLKRLVEWKKSTSRGG